MRFKMASFTRSKDSATDGSNGNVHVGAVILQPWNSWSDHGMRGLWDCIQQKISKGLGDVYRNFVICHLKKISPVYIWLINRLMCSSSYMEWWLDDPSCFFFYGWIGHQLLPLHPSAWIEKIGFLAPCLCLSFAFGAFSAVSMIESFRPIFLKKCKSCPMIWRSRDHVGFIKFVWHFLNRDVNTLNVVFFSADGTGQRLVRQYEWRSRTAPCIGCIVSGCISSMLGWCRLWFTGWPDGGIEWYRLAKGTLW
jgi:hypothetical protein